MKSHYENKYILKCVASGVERIQLTSKNKNLNSHSHEVYLAKMSVHGIGDWPLILPAYTLDNV